MSKKRNPGHGGGPERADRTRLSKREKALDQILGRRGVRVRPDGAIVRDRSHRKRTGASRR